MSIQNKYKPEGVYTTLKELVGIRRFITPDKHQQLVNKFSIVGETSSCDIGQGMEFAQVRLYDSSDDSRHIDWRVTARKQKTHIKVFHEQFDSPVYLILDQSSSLFFGSNNAFKSVTAASIASWFCWKLSQNEHPVGATIFNNQKITRLQPKLETAHIINLCQQFSFYNNLLNPEFIETSSVNSQLTKALKMFAQEAPSFGRLFVVSDFLSWDNEMQSVIMSISRYLPIRICLVFDPMEAKLPSNGLLKIANNKQTKTINSSDKKVVTAWNKLFVDRLTKIKDFAKRHKNIQIQDFSTDDFIG